MIRALGAKWVILTVISFSPPAGASDLKYSKEDVIHAFNKVAFSPEFGGGDEQNENIKKWKKDVILRVTGSSNLSDFQEIEKNIIIPLINDISLITKLNIDYQNGLSTQASQIRNFFIFIEDRTRFPDLLRLLKSKLTVQSQGLDFVSVYESWLSRNFQHEFCAAASFPSPQGIVLSVVVIEAVDGKNTLIKECLNEEVVQGFGLLNDMQDGAASLFADDHVHSVMTPLDRCVLSILYSEEVGNGFSRDDMERVFRNAESNGLFSSSACEGMEN